jgi:hypothetical protein
MEGFKSYVPIIISVIALILGIGGIVLGGFGFSNSSKTETSESVGIRGPTGPAGPRGPTGPAGTSGSSVNNGFTQEQINKLNKLMTISDLADLMVINPSTKTIELSGNIKFPSSEYSISYRRWNLKQEDEYFVIRDMYGTDSERLAISPLLSMDLQRKQGSTNNNCVNCIL